MTNMQKIFWKLYNSSTESEVDKVLAHHPDVFQPDNWKPYGQNESNLGVVENQQASSIPALVEKIINSIDAILMRRCYEEGIDPKSPVAPRSIEKAVSTFFPNAKHWDLSKFRRQQAESIQVIADGPRMNTSLVVYDDGEGQRPEDFEHTFLSLLRGNKNEIHFVQGKYNMGGAGAVAFCGKKRYQLIGSKRWDGNGNFGFTLLRRHPLTPEERFNKRNTWYEYLVVKGGIPSFPIEELDLGLYGRTFKTGSILKLYSYDLPSGSRSVISRDLNQSLNEYLFAPGLPILTVDTEERYPKDRNLQRELFGLQRRLEEDGSRYVAEFFSEDLSDRTIGSLRVTCYVFKPRIDDQSARESKQTIQREFFKNNMAVLFSVNGQVHGHYTSEFITRSLKFQLLKRHLLIHVDCTDVQPEFRNELFMASRDRIKVGEESRALRQKLADLLSRGRLKEIYKQRKASITVESEDTQDLLRHFSRNLPFQEDLLHLLNQTMKIDKKSGARASTNTRKNSDSRSDDQGHPPFEPQRYPSLFKLDKKTDNGMPLIKVPLGGERTIRFSTDVEDHYFDRVSDPGELQLALLEVTLNQTSGGTKSGLPEQVAEVLNVNKSSPQEGTIRVTVNPTQLANVGDSYKLRAELSSPSGSLEEIFLVKITEPKSSTKKKNGPPEPDMNLGLPNLVLTYKDPTKGQVTWDALEDQGIDMDYPVVMHPFVEGDVLKTIYVNMESSVLLNNRSKLSTEEAISVAEKRYLSAVYFHTIFLYMIARNRNYSVVQEDQGQQQEVELTEFLKDLFETYYAEFLLSFEVQDLISALEE